jgi:hypothetical protein
MASGGDRYFVQGSTVHLRVRVSEPGTRTPADATVVLTSLKTGGTAVTPATTAFTRVNQGDYLLVLPTAPLAPGAYDVRITVSDGPAKVSIITDRFVVKVD